MNKYLQVFKISFQQEFAYRTSFIMWRVRNVLQIFLVFSLWDTVFADSGRVLFGYDRAKILTYVFGLMFVKAFVLSARAMEVAGEISRGELSDYLIRPINYFRYWLTRDVSSKVLNILFAIAESIILFMLLRPPFIVQTNPLILFAFILALVVAMFIFFTLVFIISSVPFWMPEAGWGVHFLVTVVVVEFLSGAIFPLDVFPVQIQNILNYTPFPYLIFYPLQIYLGNISGAEMLRGLVISGAWLIFLWVLLNWIWGKGLKAYQAYGK